MRGFIKTIKPNPYNATASITLFSPIPPDVYARFYDPVWDGGLVDSNYDVENYKHDDLFRYPFKDSAQEGTFSNGGDSSDPGFDETEFRFDDESFADSQDPNQPN